MILDIKDALILQDSIQEPSTSPKYDFEDRGCLIVKLLIMLDS